MGKGKGKERKQYSQEEKDKLIELVKSYDAEHNGRGGLAFVVKDKKVSYLTLKKWMEGKSEKVKPSQEPPSEVSFIGNKLDESLNKIKKLEDVIRNAQKDILMEYNNIKSIMK